MTVPDLLEIAPSLYRLRIPGGPAHALNCHLWVEATGVTLIDTGWPDSAHLVEMALAELSLRRADVVRIVLTHFHDDHAGSAAEIAAWGEAEVVAGIGDAAFVDGSTRGPLPSLTEREQVLHPGLLEPPHGPACPVHRYVRDGDVLAFGGGAQVLGVGAHTPGSIAVHLPQVQAVLTGDVVAELHGQVVAGVFHWDRSAIPAALGRLADTGARIAGVGHGEALIGDAARLIREATDPFA